MDRFGVEVDADGVLTIDTTNLTLGPLPHHAASQASSRPGGSRMAACERLHTDATTPRRPGGANRRVLPAGVAAALRR